MTHVLIRWLNTGRTRLFDVASVRDIVDTKIGALIIQNSKDPSVFVHNRRANTLEGRQASRLSVSLLWCSQYGKNPVLFSRVICQPSITQPSFLNRERRTDGEAMPTNNKEQGAERRIFQSGIRTRWPGTCARHDRCQIFMWRQGASAEECYFKTIWRVCVVSNPNDGCS